MVILCVMKSEKGCSEALRLLKESDLVREAVGFCSVKEAAQWSKTHVFDCLLAEYSVDAPEIRYFAGELRSGQPLLPILVCSSNTGLAYEAFQIHADGFLTLPLDTDAIHAELKYLCSRRQPRGKLLTVRVYGGFEVFDRNGHPLHFKRTPAKRMMAYLVNQNGVGVDSESICMALWGDSSYSKRDYLKKTIMELHRVLREADASDVLIRTGYAYSLDMSRIMVDSAGNDTLRYMPDVNLGREE